jgi:hypothetical protein
LWTFFISAADFPDLNRDPPGRKVHFRANARKSGRRKKKTGGARPAALLRNGHLALSPTLASEMML